LDEVYDFICDEEGRPKIKTHGFGVTSLHLMMRYPWYSCDSTSWRQYGIYGGILVPAIKNGGYDYTQTPLMIFVSEKSPRVEDSWQHYKTVPPIVRQQLDDYFAENGVSFETLTTSNVARDTLNIRFFLGAEREIPADKRFDRSLLRKGFF
jgi:hypothetical protein